ncbi:MAG: hypothetical protein J1F68_03885 [Clostridiales bacterium]|nr:hypothetical protein [Clostridiales bacterium]
MKYNCEKEFDLKEIYRKLTSSTAPQMVKASNFFAPVTFEQFQEQMELAMLKRKQTTN